MGIATCFYVVRMLMTAFEPCSDLYYPVTFFVGLVCCKMCRQLESCVLIQSSLRRQSGCQYASDASHRREGVVCKEGQGSHCCWQVSRLRRMDPFSIFVTKPNQFI